MPLPQFVRRLRRSAAVVAFAAAAACSDPLAPLPANSTNVVDTVRIFALRGTAIPLPSGFDIASGSPTRTDQLGSFDFAFDITPAGQPTVYPAGALGLESPTGPSGLLASNGSFDSIDRAPLDGYDTRSALAVSAGTVFVGRSRPNSAGCGFTGSLPRYGKFRVLGIDLQARSLSLEALVNLNCGYRGLQPGIPSF